MTDVAPIITHLKNLDLSINPYDDVRESLSKLGEFGFIKLTLHATNEFIRARPLDDGEEIKVVSDLSYKPQNYNNTYQRASTPNKTMFYASLVQPGFTPQGFLALGRLVGLLESVPFMRDINSKGIKRIAFGKWSNTRDMNLAAIVYNDQFSTQNPQTEFLFNAFNNHVQNIPALHDKTLAVTQFLASEFAKENITDHHSYMISAIFSELSAEKGFDGILYPSVRTSGTGLNIAIIPEFVDKYMELRTAGECTIYKNGAQTKVLNDTVTTIPRGQTVLKLKPFDNPSILEAQRKQVLKELHL